MRRLRDLIRCHAMWNTSERSGRCERSMFHGGFHSAHLFDWSGTVHW